MTIHPDHLLTLAYVARTGSLTQAAALLGKTQPAISAQIKLLNDAVGEPVVIRHRKGMSLSRAGEALLPSAQIIARATDIAEQIGQRLHGVDFGELRLACATSISVYFLPPVLALFHQRHASIKLKVTNHSTQNAIKTMESGNADLAIVHGPVNDLPANFTLKHIMDDETILALRRDHPLAKRKNLKVADLNGLSVVSQGPASATNILIENLANRAKIKLDNRFEVVNVEAIKEAILQGFGAGFLSRLSVHREVKSGSLVALRIRDGHLQRPIALIHPQENQISPRIGAFLAVLDDAKKSIGHMSGGGRGSPNSRR